MKVGIIGLGIMANTMAETLVKMKEVECHAVASRNIEKANAFKEKHGFTKAYGSYQELFDDEEIELVYIATPHSNHYEEMMACLHANKAVLCEKAFTVNAKQAKEVCALAKEKNILVAEAIWTRYMPSRKLLDKVIASGIIGTPSVLNANLCYKISHIDRITDPQLAGGALLDVGVYPLNFASMVFGNDIKALHAHASFTDTNVDSTNTITLIYNDNRVASLFSSMQGGSNRMGHIVGDKGYINVTNINNIEKIEVFDLDHHLVESYDVSNEISGYEHQVLSCIKAMEQGKYE
ncbi:MAG: Gfo/Idh/MocA family oxidoreductase, partial [Erysipelotrichaceae bacterium]